jgi:hypothetical protein
MLEHLPETAIEMFFGALAGGSTGEASGAAVGAATPLAIRVGHTALQRIRQVRHIAVRETGLSLPEMAEWTATSDDHVEFLVRLLEAARRAGLEEKRVALGRVAARALTDDAALDESLLLLEAIDALDALHIRVLMAISRPRPGDGQLEGRVVSGSIDLDELSRCVPDSRPSLRATIAVLQGRGAVTDSSPATWDQVEGKERWVLSEFGRDLIALLLVESGTGEPP